VTNSLGRFIEFSASLKYMDRRIRFDSLDSLEW